MALDSFSLAKVIFLLLISSLTALEPAESLHQHKLELLLEPSRFTIQALTLVVESPGLIDLSELEFSLVGTATAKSLEYLYEYRVEYAVVRLPQTEIQPTNKIGTSHCNQYRCDFLTHTDDLVKEGIGVKEPTLAEYLWCAQQGGEEDDEYLTLSVDSRPNLEEYHRYNIVSLQGGTTTTIEHAKIQIAESGTYAILLANCGKEFDGGYVVKVDGLLSWTAQSTSDETEPRSTTVTRDASPQSSTPEEESLQATEEPPIVQAMLAPLILIALLGAVYMVKEKEGSHLREEDAYMASSRNAGYKSLPMMDLSGGNS